MSTKRNPRRCIVHEEIGLQIAPMIDVTLLLLFFFMLSGKLTKKAKLKGVNMPVASTGSAGDSQGEREVINITQNGDWYAGDQRVSKAELGAYLQARFKNHPPLKLQVRADALTPAVKIKELISLAAEAGAIEIVYGVKVP